MRTVTIHYTHPVLQHVDKIYVEVKDPDNTTELNAVMEKATEYTMHGFFIEHDNAQVMVLPHHIKFVAVEPITLDTESK